jgi:hypothetical protein
VSAPVNFPDIGAPFTDANGRLSTVWMQFLLQMFTRSGGTNAPADITALTALVQTLEGWIASQVPVYLPPAIEPESLAPTHGLQDAGDLHALVTQAVNGFMSAADKAKLDGITATVEDKFASGTGFTPGSTTALTLSKSYASAAAVLVHFDGVFQGTDQYSISGTTITFTSPIPVGTSMVYARG